MFPRRLPTGEVAIICTSAYGDLRELFTSFVGSRKVLKSRWLWPFGLAATGLAGAAVVLLRGCWHRKMSWPVRVQEHTYQVCLGCGVKRLFDEDAFRSYGPYSYDLNRLLAWDRLRKREPVEPSAPSQERSAS